MTLVFGNLVILILNKADTFLPGDKKSRHMRTDNCW